MACLNSKELATAFANARQNGSGAFVSVELIHSSEVMGLDVVTMGRIPGHLQTPHGARMESCFGGPSLTTVLSETL